MNITAAMLNPVLEQLYHDQYETMLSYGFHDSFESGEYIEQDALADALANGTLASLLTDFGLGHCDHLSHITAQDVLHCLEPDNPALQDVAILIEAMFSHTEWAEWACSNFSGCTTYRDVISFLDSLETELVESGQWEYGLTNTYVFLSEHYHDSDLILSAMHGNAAAKAKLITMFLEPNV